MRYLSPEQSTKKRSARMDAADAQFEEARRIAGDSGLALRQCDLIHYQLAPLDGSWLLNIYPSNRRLYRDPNRAKAPYLRLPDEWTLLEVVIAAKLEKPREAPPADETHDPDPDGDRRPEHDR